MPTDVIAVEESSTSTPTPNFEPSTYSAEELSTWNATGKLPDLAPPSLEKSTPSKETAGAVKTDETATESATVLQQQEHKGKGAEARKAELHAEIQSLLKQRDTLKAKPDVATAAPSPAAKETKVNKPVKPIFGETDGETWAQFEARNEAYSDEKIAAAIAGDRQLRETERTEAANAAASQVLQDGWDTRVESAKTLHVDFAEVAFSKDTPISNVMDGFILDSESGPEILYYLGGHVDEAKAIAAMPPYKAARALVAIEKSLAGEATPPAKVAPVVIPPTKAARPATDLRSTNAAPADDMKAAVEADDFARFSEIQNAKSIARRKQG